jgi:hypothetical protein
VYTVDRIDVSHTPEPPGTPVTLPSLMWSEVAVQVSSEAWGRALELSVHAHPATGAHCLFCNPEMAATASRSSCSRPSHCTVIAATTAACHK